MIRPFCAPLRELAFPGERGSDNGRKIVEAWLPAKRRSRLPRVGNDPRRIALAPRHDLDLEINARDALDGLDNVEHRKAVVIAAIERQRWQAGPQVTQRVGVRAGKIADVNVVANAGAVRRRV